MGMYDDMSADAIEQRINELSQNEDSLNEADRAELQQLRDHMSMDNQ